MDIGDRNNDVTDPDIVNQHFYNCREITDLGHNNIIKVGELNILNTNNYF